jgi:hypothetical protein
MLKQRPILDITCSNDYWVRVQVDKVMSYFFLLAREMIADHHDLHRFESNAEHSEFIYSASVDNRYIIL